MITFGKQSDQMQLEVTDESRSSTLETFEFSRELAIKHLSSAFSFSSFVVSFKVNNQEDDPT